MFMLILVLSFGHFLEVDIFKYSIVTKWLKMIYDFLLVYGNYKTMMTLGFSPEGRGSIHHSPQPSMFKETVGKKNKTPFMITSYEPCIFNVLTHE